jgi:hypothetical protein
MMTVLFLGLSVTVGQPAALPQPARPAAALLAPVVPESAQQPPAKDAQPAPASDSGTYHIHDGARPGCLHRFFKFYVDEFHPKPDDGKDENGNGKAENGNGNGENGNGKNEEPKRRALPAPFESPPFPTAEYQGFPLIGVPADDHKFAFMQALDGTQFGRFLDDTHTRIYGWINASANWTNNRVTNTPTSYWVVPNQLELDQAVIRVERTLDTVQRDHIDWGYRLTVDYGMDYRYFTAGGWFSRQLLVNNNLYGWDPTEAFVNFYFPGVARGMILTIGRWIACPDIETQFAPDNYMGTHSIQFTVDVYTETGVMATFMLNDQWLVQACIHSGADMAPWYQGAQPTGMFGVRWVSKDNNDSFYTVLNAVGNANFQYFEQDGVLAGHHNYNIIQSTWQHRFTPEIFTKTEAYYMWEHNAPVGGTPSIGPVQFGLGNGLGAIIPGTSATYGILNYTMFQMGKKDFLVFRNEWMKDENGTRYGYAGNYTSNSIGWTHNFTQSLQVRPEVGYYRNWNTPTFDNGQRKDMFMVGLDMTIRF